MINKEGINFFYLRNKKIYYHFLSFQKKTFKKKLQKKTKMPKSKVTGGKQI